MNKLQRDFQMCFCLNAVNRSLFLIDKCSVLGPTDAYHCDHCNVCVEKVNKKLIEVTSPLLLEFKMHREKQFSVVQSTIYFIYN